MKTVICGEKREAMQDMSLLLDDATFKEYSKWNKEKLTSKAKADGFLEGEKYIMIWAAGHLYMEIMPADIKPEWGLMQALDSPKDYLLVDLKSSIKKIPNKEKLRQIKICKKILSRDDYDTFIHAGDADDEGETIVRDIIEFCVPGNKKSSVNFLRMWNTGSFKVKSSIDKAMSELKPLDDSKFINCYYSQKARSFSDYLSGLKSTKCATDFGGGGKVLSMGRVQSFVLDLPCRRDDEIKDFEKNGPKKFYTINGDFKGISFKHYYGVKKDDKTIKEYQYNKKDVAFAIVEKINESGNVFKVLKYEKDTTFTKNRPLPLSGGDFANEMMKKYKISYKACNIILKELRNQGFTTYEGTDGNYFALSDKGEVVEALNTCLEYFKNDDYIKNRVGTIVHNDSVGIYNDSKASKQNHTPLNVTNKVPTRNDIQNWETSKIKYLKEGYELIAKRILVHFLEDDEIIKEKILLISKFKNYFESNNEAAIKQGWRTFLNMEKDSNSFNIDIKEEQVIKLDSVELHEGKTKKPKKFKVNDILSLMINVVNWFDEQISEEDDPVKKEQLKKFRKAVRSAKGIGTTRTRENIIKNLTDRGMITVGSTGVVDVTEFGRMCNDATPEYLKSVVTTASWEMKFDEIRRGEFDYQKFIDVVDNSIMKKVIPEIYKYFKEKGFNKPKKKEPPKETKIICPLCAKKGVNDNALVKNDSFYKCSSGKYNPKTKRSSGCNFFIKREQKFGDRVLDDKDLMELFNKKSIKYENGNKLLLDLENQYFVIFEFPEKKEGRGGNYSYPQEFEEREKMFCMNGKFIWKKFFDYAFSHDEAKRLLNDEEIDIEMMSKKKKPYTVTVWWDESLKRFGKKSEWE